MPVRLSPLEASLLALETAQTPCHVATVHVFNAGSADLDKLVRLVGERLAFVPRYRQRVRWFPGLLGAPVWVDDSNFDLDFHVRRVALPRPGSIEALRDFAGWVVSSKLDRSRPLWEIHLVEGLAGNRIAVVAKSHLCLVDGIDAVDLGQVWLDAAAEVGATPTTDWYPLPDPGVAELVAGALWQSAQDPAIALENVRGAVAGVLGLAVAVGGAVGGVGGTLEQLAGTALRGRTTPADSPLAGPLSTQRRVAMVSAPLEPLEVVRGRHGCTVHEAVLAMVTGGLRSWLTRRGKVAPEDVVMALVPVAVAEHGAQPTALGVQVEPRLVALPIGEPSPLRRLEQIMASVRDAPDNDRAVGAVTLTALAGFAPSTLHALGARAAAGTRQRHELLVSNVPGPQEPVYAAGLPLVASYPLLPLAAGQLLAIGVTSYQGGICLAITADRVAVPDVDALAQRMFGALEQLVNVTAPPALTSGREEL